MIFTNPETISKILVRVDNVWVNEYTSKSGIKLRIDTTWMRTKDTARVGVVECCPRINIIGARKGDMVIFHPNQIKPSLLKGKEVPSIGEFIKSEGLYLIDQTEIYAIQRGKELITTLDNCFVLPCNKIEDNILSRNIELDLTGVMAYPNEELLNQGIKEGDTVLFDKFSKHVFKIDGKRMFRMRTRQINGVVE